MLDDKTLEFLLDLDSQIMVINNDLGIWVKFEVKRVVATKDRPHGVRYSLSLHDRNNERMMGFDNAHAVEYGKKNNVAPKEHIIIGIKTKVIKGSLMSIQMLVN